MKKAIYVLSILMLLASCKKDKLKDEKEILIGTWDWVYTKKVDGWCDNMEIVNYYTAEIETNSFSIEFQKKGFVLFYENDILLNRQRVVFKHFLDGLEPSYYQTVIYLDNNKENKLGLQVSTDSLRLGSFPIDVEEEKGCGYANNYFSRR